MRLLTIALLCLFSTISFAQEKPLWMRYPAISPDGSQVVFSYGGDLYKVSVNGGDAERLTVHEAHDFEAVWSKDGKHIAFASDRHGNFDVFVIPAEGGEAKRLTYHSADDHPSDFTPDNKHVIYTSSRLDAPESIQFPSGVLSELYKVSVDGGREMQVITTPAELARYNKDGSKLIFHDRKGYENEWRKHHTSSVTRDIWTYNTNTGEYQKVIAWEGEDRNPVWKDSTSIYFLTERSGSFNVWQTDISSGSESNTTQVTSFDTHPVRFLSRANSGTLLFSYDGEIYKMTEGGEPELIDIRISTDDRYNETVVKMIKSGAEEFDVSPNGKEIAFVERGEVFVTSIEYGNTKRITNTPQMERSVQFSPDGKHLLYSTERDSTWNIYQASLGREEDKYFYNATVIKEEPLVATDEEEFQGMYSPDGKEVAYLEDRTTLKVLNIESGETRTVLPGSKNYSYADGDQYFTWAPDSKWLLVQYLATNRWNEDIGLVKASGGEEPINLSRSGYNNSRPKFGMGGEMVYWSSDKRGYRSHGSWGSQSDVYAIFLTEDAWQKFNLSKAEYDLWKEENKEEKKEEDKDDKKKKDDEEEEEKVEPLKIELDGLYDRKERLTIHSSFLADFLVDKEGENLYYMAQFEEGYDLWKTDFKESETKILAKLNASGSGLQFDKKEENIFLLNRGSLTKVDVKKGEQKGINFSAEMNLNKAAEREYMFRHAWRQMKEKFYLKDLHGVDWEMYRKEYAKFLPHINNGYDFAEMLSELLGEVNASHTGSGYRAGEPTDDNTAALGAYFDEEHDGDGLLIAEIMDKSPLLVESDKVKAGAIIESINGEKIEAGENYYPLLNRKAGDKLLFTFYNPKTKDRWEEVIEPISRGQENQLAYERWVKSREAAVDSLSNGQLGYVHVRGMNSSSFREVYDKALGKYNDRKALIVDTRFNGGGWLHDDLATFLDGEPYLRFLPRGQDNMGGEPLGKWQKPSIVLVSESNYSDAHLFPWVYKRLNIGKLVGMPVPGTGTAVWWETLIDGHTYFGIPQVGMQDLQTGELLENQELQPDVKVENEPEAASSGEDQQLQKAVEVMLEEVGQ
ncbi:S41 family peptidase [Halocola ammonii]